VFCVECGKEIPNGVKFCPDCGASQIAKVEENPVKAKPKKEVLPKKIDYSKMSIAEVKKIVKSKKLPVSGPKWRLIERLTNKNWKENEEKERKERQKWMEENPIHDAGNNWLFTKGGLIFSCFTAYFLTFFFILWLEYDITKELRTNIDHSLRWAFVVCIGIPIILIISFSPLFLLSENTPTSKNEQSFTLVYIASLLIPVAGIIIGAVYLTNKNKQTREAGTNCLVIAIISIVAYWVFVFNLFS
jgi:hypothetical protein